MIIYLHMQRNYPMDCPRFNHFRRITEHGKFSVCGHMVDAQFYDTLEQLENSKWLSSLKNETKWSLNCFRCKQEEELGNKSIRQNSIDRHKLLSLYKKDYLIIGGILDNICNSACQFCNEELSTKIGSLKFGKDYKLINNMEEFNTLPQDRIIELDINGGEPSNSPNYQFILDNLPENLQILRINTNASKYIENLETILNKNIKVYITISLDGTDKIFEYARYPLKWNSINSVIDKYLNLCNNNKLLNLNFWLTLSAYTIADLPNIINFAKQKKIELSYGLLQSPEPLNIVYSNPITLAAKQLLKDNHENLYNIVASKGDNTEKLLHYIKTQDSIRGTNYKEYYDWNVNEL